MAQDDILAAAQRYRAALLRHDQAAARLIRQHYATASAEVQRRLDYLIQQIEQANAAGQAPRISWLFQQAAYQQFLGITGLEMEQFARQTGQTVTHAQRDVAELAIEMARDLAGDETQHQWRMLTSHAVEHMIGALASGPLADLLSPFAREAQEDAKTQLVLSVALKENPRQTARRVQQALGMSQARALRISRTEILRAHREATRLSYLENSSIVRGWTWLSAMDTRTCPACWAMTGQVFPIDEPLGSHPNCRCVMVPLTDPLAGPGGEDASPLQHLHNPVPNGELRFITLPAEEQEQILGPAAYRAYQAGDVSLAELVGYRDDQKWGPTRFTRSLRSLGITPQHR